jgi:hypothetical protein
MPGSLESLDRLAREERTVTRRKRLAAESVREIALLVLVFAPLDAWLAREATVPWWVIPVIFMIALFVLACGVKLEAEAETSLEPEED